jgi:hypothetical protein
MIRRLFMAAMLPAIAMLCAGAMAAPGIKPFDRDGMRRILAHEAGRPFVIMVWSLDCTIALPNRPQVARRAAAQLLV